MRRATAALTVALGCASLAGCASRSSSAGDAPSGGVVLASANATNAATAANPPNAASGAGAGAAVRCALLADSIRTKTPQAKLPIARMRGRYALPTPGPGVTQGEVRTTFLVDPTGSAVPGSVVVTGPANATFRQEMEEALRGAAFRPPTVSGCPSWSRGDIRIRARIERRRMD